MRKIWDGNCKRNGENKKHITKKKNGSWLKVRILTLRCLLIARLEQSPRCLETQTRTI